MSTQFPHHPILSSTDFLFHFFSPAGMSSTRAYFLFLLLFGWASLISCKSHVRRAGSDPIGYPLNDINDNGKRPHSDECGDPEQQPPASQKPSLAPQRQSLPPVLKYAFNDIEIDSYAMPVPQEGQAPVEVQFINKMYGGKNNRKSGVMFIHLPTTGAPWVFTIPAKPLSLLNAQSWTGKRKSAILREHKTRLKAAWENRPKNVEFRAHVIIGHPSMIYQNREHGRNGMGVALTEEILSQFQKITRKSVGVVGLSDWTGHDARVQCEHREVLEKLEEFTTKTSIGPPGIACMLYLSGEDGKEKNPWDFQTEPADSSEKAKTAAIPVDRRSQATFDGGKLTKKESAKIQRWPLPVFNRDKKGEEKKGEGTD